MLQESCGVERHSGGQRRRLRCRLALTLIRHQRVQRPSLLRSHLALHGAAQWRTVDDGKVGRWQRWRRMGAHEQWRATCRHVRLTSASRLPT